MLATLLKNLLSRRFTAEPARLTDVHALYERGDLVGAERACAGIADAPQADIDFLQGLIARKAGDLDRAAVCMGAAVESRPEEPAFRMALGEVLFAMQRWEGALEHFEVFVSNPAASTDARTSGLRQAAQCCFEIGDNARARTYLESAVAASPREPMLRDLLASALARESRMEDARATLEPLLSTTPGLRLRRALFLPSVYDSTAQIAEVRERLSRELDEVIADPGPRVEEPTAQIGVTAFHLAYHNCNNAALLEKVCRAMRSVYAAPHARTPRRGATAARIRVGFVSTFFRTHSVARVTLGLIRDLPRDRFAVSVFAVGQHFDAMSRAMEAAADRWLRLPRDLREVRRSIEESALDVLIFADLGMDPFTYMLALSRLAPVQAVWWGHSETSGIETVDYYLSAAGVEVEDAQTHYTESLVRPDAFFLPGFERPVLEQEASRDDLGLPVGTRLYACLQSIFKLHPDIDAIFAAILERDPGGEILLLESKPAAAERVRRRMERSIGADARRIRFLGDLSMQRYLATLKAADVALDPLYFGGCNSSCEAVALGVPLVTLPGDHLHGRFTLALYREMGIDRCVAASTAEYAELACSIARDKDLRHDLGRELAARSEVVFQRNDITLAYADFLERAVASQREAWPSGVVGK